MAEFQVHGFIGALEWKPFLPGNSARILTLCLEAARRHQGDCVASSSWSAYHPAATVGPFIPHRRKSVAGSKGFPPIFHLLERTDIGGACSLRRTGLSCNSAQITGKISAIRGKLALGSTQSTGKIGVSCVFSRFCWLQITGKIVGGIRENKSR